MKSRFFQVSVKIILAVFVLVQLGLPILDLWKMLLLLGSWLALACCDLRLNRRRIYLSIAVVIFVIAIKNILPNASINEGHNIFLYTEDGSALQRGLPPEIFKEWRQAFEKQYPPEQYPNALWRQTIPTTLYAHSSDALWRTARYSRQVDIISFKNLSEFRGGFANVKRYNFFGDDPISIARNLQVQLPFFVMYEFSEQSAGCTLHWRGTVYWQKDAESFEKIVNHDDSGRVITEEDIGKRVYALNLPAVFAGGYKEWFQSRNPAHTPPLSELAMHLDLSPKLKASRAVGNLLSFLGVLALIGLMTRINWKSYLIAISLTALSLIIIGVFIHYSNGKFLGPEYPTHGGGDDGLTFESYGRDIARMAMSGNLKEALKGLEEVYYYTPGMRYFRAVEKIFFGDTNLGYTALVALLAWFVYLLIRHFSGFKWGMACSILFLLILPLGSLSFLQYIQNAKLGYAEAAGFGFFILGFYLFIRSNPRWGGQQDGFFAFTGGICLACSMFLRPNFAIAVSLLGLLYVFTSWRAKSFKIMIAAMAGLAFALWMPLHNYLYGHRFVLMVSTTKMIMTLSPLTYLQAGYELLFGNWNDQHVNEVIKQLSGWLWTPPRLPHSSLKVVAELFMVMKLVTLAVTVFIAFRSIFLRQEAIFVLAWTALAIHIPMLFIFASGQFRYAMLAWDLSAILTLIIVADLFRKSSAHINP